MFLSETKKYHDVLIQPNHYKDLKKSTIDRWKEMIDYMTEVLDVSVGFVMRVTETHIKEFVKSTYRRYPTRVYKTNELRSGMFCETVLINDKELLVNNISEHRYWSGDNTITMNSDSYYGVPIHYPNGDMFGTLCVLDRKDMEISVINKALVQMIRDSIEKDIELLTTKKEISTLSIIDPLTELYNKRKIEEIIFEYQHEINRKISIVSIAYIRINNFSSIRDEHGDEEADDILILLSKLIKNRSRQVDRIGRMALADFVILSKGSDAEGQEVLLKDLRDIAETHLQLAYFKLEFAYGIAEVNINESISDRLIESKDQMEKYVTKHFTK